MKLATANGQAQLGQYSGPHPAPGKDRILQVGLHGKAGVHGCLLLGFCARQHAVAIGPQQAFALIGLLSCACRP